MNGILNKNQLTIVKEYEFIKPLIHKIDSIIDNCIKDCHNKYCHTFDHICMYDINLTNITNIEIINLTISGKSMNFYELKKNLKNARRNGFEFNQINELTLKIYSNLSNLNIPYYLKLQKPIMHRHFSRILSQNPDDVQTHCNDRNKPFHFACRKWYLYNDPQC